MLTLLFLRRDTAVRGVWLGVSGTLLDQEMSDLHPVWLHPQGHLLIVGRKCEVRTPEPREPQNDSSSVP